MSEMTKFTDGLFDDLMREHGAALTATPASAPNQKRRFTARPVLLSAGAAGVALAATVGTLAAGGGTPAYAVTANSDGSVSVAVYQASGYAGANAKLRELGDEQVVVVPVRAGCPSIRSLRKPVRPVRTLDLSIRPEPNGSYTIQAKLVPAGDIVVVPMGALSPLNDMTDEPFAVTSPPAPRCVSIPPSAPPVEVVSGSAAPRGSGTGSAG
jgi:hypothetical protein